MDELARANTSHCSAQPSPWNAAARRAANPRFLLPCVSFSTHAFTSSPGCAHHPGVGSGSAVCSLCQTPLPQPQPQRTRAGGCSRGVVLCRLPVGRPSAKPVLVPVGACPREEHIAQCKKRQYHVSHPRAPGSEEEIPGGTGRGLRQMPTCPIGCQIPWGPIPLPHREEWVLGAIYPQCCLDARAPSTAWGPSTPSLCPPSLAQTCRADVAKARGSPAGGTSSCSAKPFYSHFAP